MKKKIIIGVVIVIILTITLSIVGVIILNQKKVTPQKPTKKPTSYNESNYHLNLIKTVNSTQEDNYLISPYSIEIALSMLKEGANNHTKEEIEKVISSREIKDISIKDRIEVANAIFVKDNYKNSINQSFETTMKNKYQSEVLYDKFTTPNVINNWVKEKTHKMIDKILDEMSSEFVLGIANALAIDVEWLSSFECNNTTEETFTKENQEEMKVEMMHQSYKDDASYFETDNAKGIILPYKSYEEDNHLEFIGILPNQDINSFIEGLTIEELEAIDQNKEDATKDLKIILSLPRFTYDFTLNGFTNVLRTMGIKDAFDEDLADFTNIITREEMNKQDINNLFVSTAIHKTHIDLNEKGTKAAAVTYFGLDYATGIIEKSKEIKIKFNQPFIYMIRDYKTKELLFFGVVKEPNEWKKTTCKES